MNGLAPPRTLSITATVLLGLATVTPALAVDVLVPAGADWKYLDTGVAPAAGWTDLGFADGSWLVGPAQLGYGDGDEATVVSYGPDPADKYVTTYFRKEFTVADASLYSELSLDLLRDDGAVVRLNGVELYRSNLPAGAVTASTLASSTVSGAAEDLFTTVALPTDALQSGGNLLAVEIHQVSPTSSDISFDLELRGVTPGSPPALLRGPYLQRGAPGEVTVCWRTSPASDGRVRFGPAPDQLTSTVVDTAVSADHEVRITGLAAATRYYYAVGSTSGDITPADFEHNFLTHPVPGTAQPFRAWAIGDSGTADASAAAVRDAYFADVGTGDTEVWLMLGDNAYSSGTDDQYQAAVFDMYPTLLEKSILWPTFGNHDGISASSSGQSGPYYDIFVPPTAGESGGIASGTQAYYSFDYANVHFICLDSQGSDRSATGAMGTWLAADLADTSQEWIIAFFHHPPYTKGSHDSDDAGDSGGRMRDMREQLLPVLEDGGVDLVLSGHSHSYERSFLLDGHYDTSSTLDPTTMVVDGGDGSELGDGAYQKSGGGVPHEGAVYVVAGSSGKTSSGPLDHPAMFYSAQVLGSVVLEFDGPRLDLRFLRETGAVDDEFTILKAPPLPTSFRRGDVNSDGALDVTDVIATLDYLFNSLAVSCHSAMDSDDDGGVNITDAVYTLWFEFVGGAPPPAPYPNCGIDPTPDALTCTTASCP